MPDKIPPQDPIWPDPNSGRDQPNDPAEGPRDGDDSGTDAPVPSTHTPDGRAFDL